jgi:hypothetical protein
MLIGARHRVKSFWSVSRGFARSLDAMRRLADHSEDGTLGTQTCRTNGIQWKAVGGMVGVTPYTLFLQFRSVFA